MSGTSDPIPATPADAPPAPPGPLPVRVRPRATSAARRRGPALPLLRAVLAVAGVGLAGFAEHLVADARDATQAAPPALSWWLFGVAAILFAAAGWIGREGAPHLLAAVPAPILAAWRAMRQRRLVAILLGLAILAGLAAIPLFITINATPTGNVPPEPANTGAWLLWIAALLLFGAAFVVWERQAPPAVEGTEAGRDDRPWGGERLPVRIEWALIAGLFVLALALRLPDLASAPPGLWFDEAENGLVAQQVTAAGAAHPTFIGGFTQMGGLYFYVLGVLLHLFGTTIWPLRVLPALGGAALVPLLYLLGSRLYGWRVGLAAAGLLAVSAWNITFSRFGIASLPTVALDVAVYVCAAQALRTGRLGYFAGAGVLLGLAVQMYYVARLVPILLVLVLVHLLITQRMRLVRAVRGGLVVLALGALLGFLPVGLFALQQPDVFGGRVDTVSIFNPQVNGGDPNALPTNLNKHLLMFNFHGDANGRHNLAGAPQLDDITALLFILGLGVCVLRLWRWQYFFPLVWFAAALSGGVLSVPFEAPQSHRTLENSVVTALIAGIVLGELWTYAARLLAPAAAAANAAPARGPLSGVMRRRLAWTISGLGVLAGVAWVGSITIPRYFSVQAQDRSIWEDMNAPQAVAATELRQSGAQAHMYLSPAYLGTPAQQYLAAGVPADTWPGLAALPFSSADGRDVVLILDPPLAGDLSFIAGMYPHATFDGLYTPLGQGPMLYTIRIPASDITALHGVRASLFDPGATTAREERSLSSLSFDWGSAGGKPGTVRLAATLRADTYGRYSFDWQPAGPAAGGLLVDGYTITPGQVLTLPIGLHSIVATDTVQSASGIAQLRWTPPTRQGSASGLQDIPADALFDPRHIEPHGLTGLYYPNQTGEGPAQTGYIDPVISFFFYNPPPGMNRPYTAVWAGRLYVPEAGTYRLGTEQITQSTLTVDGQQVIANAQPNSLMEADLPLTAGWHDLRLQFLDVQFYSHVYLYWTPPGRPHSIIPAAFLWPQLGQYPTRPESGAWPTLAQSDATQVGAPATSGGGPPPAPPPTAAPPAATLPPAPTAALSGTALVPRFVLGAPGASLLQPRGAAADAQGNIYVYTGQDSRIAKFSPTGQSLGNWAVTGKDGKPLTEGSAVLLQNDRLWVLDAAANDLLGYDLTGQPAGSIHLCDCFSPRGVALSRDGNFWVADTGHNQVLKISPAGKLLQTLGAAGSGPGQFAEPASVWETTAGVLYVADISNNRVQSFDASGKPLAAWPMGPSIARDGNRLAGDSAGNVLVAEAASQALVRYDSQGKELGRWVYTRGGATLTPAGVVPVGSDSFAVLYLNDGLVAVFTPGAP